LCRNWFAGLQRRISIALKGAFIEALTVLAVDLLVTRVGELVAAVD
jgi:hypothetical protein